VRHDDILFVSGPFSEEIVKTRSLSLLLAIAAVSALASNPRAQLRTLPLRFEENRGRDPHPGVRFVARSPRFLLGLAPTESWLEWRDPAHQATARVQTKFLNANRNTQMELEDRLPGTANYFLGAEQNWRSDVIGFGGVHYRDVYKGVDLIFHGEQGRLEYDFVLAPHADPRAIRLELKGQDSARIDNDGDLVIHTVAGEIRWKAPEIYQDAGGERQPVAGRFVIEGKRPDNKRIVRFEIGDYDRDHTLIIDPTLKYSTYIGGTNNEAARGIGVDAAGNVYLAGVSSSPDLPSTPSSYQPNFGGRTALSSGNFTGDGFVAKFSPAGKLLYLTYLGGTRDDGIAALAVDAAGNVFVTGETYSTDFPSVNGYQKSLNSPSSQIEGDAFVTKLSPDGSKILFSTYFGGTKEEIGLGIVLDSAGNIVICGASESFNLPTMNPIPGGDRFHGGGSSCGGSLCEPLRHQTDTVPEWAPGDGFVAKFDPTGTQLLFSTYLGGGYDDAALSIAVDSSNNVYVGGCTVSFDFPNTPGAYQRGSGGIEQQNFFFWLGDGFVSKINPANSTLVFSTYIGGAGDDCVTGIALDSSNAVYMTGTTSSFNLLTPPQTVGFQPRYAGYNSLPFNIAQLFGDAFVAKLDPTGAKLQYFTFLGGSQNDGGTAIAVDSQGDAYVLGFTDSTDFPMAGSPVQPKFAGDGGLGQFLFYGDAFLSVVNPTGTALLYSSYFGGTLDERPFGIALDGKGNVYLAGNTVSPTFPTTQDAAQKNYGGYKGHANGTPRGDAFYSVFTGFPAAPPVITKVANAEGGESTTISPNTWVEIKGTNLSTAGVSSPDCAPGYCWQAADFVNNQLPTTLQGVSVTMNGKAAYIYYISDGQINVLTPPDLAAGPVQVQVSVGGIKSAAFASQALDESISFFVLNGGPYVLATHLNGTLVGPSSLFPGVTTPAKPGETIVIYANGYGPITPPVVAGSLVQSGPLPFFPTLQIGGSVANITFAGLISPGLYQFNVTVPTTVPDGDNKIQSQFAGQQTATGELITIQH
jgi:uncharacterized protein (TIGR03437 family)